MQTTRINRLYVLLSFLCFAGYESKAQLSYKVLFLGNSYTYVNDLPQLVHDVALSVGDTLIFDSNAPGGYQLVNHSLDATSQSKILAGGWDYVVIQGQSQEPIVATSSFNAGASALRSQIKQYNPCAVLMPYMTWGRKNGDAASCPWFPSMCTYEGMDTTLRNNYLDVTDDINGEVSPVSVVWHYIRQNYPLMELYQPDESHPSALGSYAAACCFYAAIFKKDPTLITFNFGLSAADAAIVKDAAKQIVFDNLQQWDFKKPPVADIRFEIGAGNNEVFFHAPGLGVMQTYLWDFGDGDTSSTQNLTHFYLNDGTYTVTLTTTTCDLQGLHTATSDTVIQFCSHTPTIYITHPTLCQYDTLWTEPADSYQWIAYGNPLPEYNQYLANYFQYAYNGFVVLSTVNGCAEFSQVFTDTYQWSGYYFDIMTMNDPCIGDTATWAVLHTSGSLSGLESILWFKNDTLLPLMTNEDTLFITSGGKYECKVIDPASICPNDTTSYSYEFDCSVSGVTESTGNLTWTLFPNPVTDILTIKFSKSFADVIEIFNATGILIRTQNNVSNSMQINVSDLSAGLYYVRSKNDRQSAMKFIKL